VFDAELRTVVGDLGEQSAYSNAKAREQLGWSPRPVEDSIAECGESLIALGAV